MEPDKKPKEGSSVKVNSPQTTDSKPAITAEGINQEFNSIRQDVERQNQFKGCFEGKRVSKWTEESIGREVPKMLFSEFWHESELCILFADTNQGKSILAVQIADSISKGKAINEFKLEALKQPVLYFDFELSAKQFEGRYAVKTPGEKYYSEHYPFDDNLIRVVINNRAIDPPTGVSFEEYLIDSISIWVKDTNAKILIIDNLTYLKNDTEKSNEAAPLVKRLQQMIDVLGVSILVLAHTPKRDLSKPITRNDLQGSKRLIDFCDSSFAIGESQRDPKVKYLKQIKARETEHIYSSENVIEVEIQKAHNFLRFKFNDYGVERFHLREVNDKERNEMVEKAVEMRDTLKMTNVEIAREFGKSEGTIRKWFKRHASKD